MAIIKSCCLCFLTAIALQTLPAFGQSAGQATETSPEIYEGPRRFSPILNMQVTPLHKNGLIGVYRTAFSSPAFNNTPAKSEATAIGKFSDFNLIACEYGIQGAATSITVLFWNNKRAKLSHEAIQLLENYRAPHYLLVDTVTRRCPLSYWDVQELNRPGFRGGRLI